MPTLKTNHKAPAIGDRLRLTRTALGLPQGEFAGRAGIAASTYNQYETGKQTPKLANAIALCETYHLTLDWLFRDDPSGLKYETAAAIAALRRSQGQP